MTISNSLLQSRVQLGTHADIPEQSAATRNQLEPSGPCIHLLPSSACTGQSSGQGQHDAVMHPSVLGIGPMTQTMTASLHHAAAGCEQDATGHAVSLR